jgi:hypothetical protein
MDYPAGTAHQHKVFRDQNPAKQETWPGGASSERGDSTQVLLYLSWTTQRLVTNDTGKFMDRAVDLPISDLLKADH